MISVGFEHLSCVFPQVCVLTDIIMLRVSRWSGPSHDSTAGRPMPARNHGDRAGRLSGWGAGLQWCDAQVWGSWDCGGRSVPSVPSHELKDITQTMRFQLYSLNLSVEWKRSQSEEPDVGRVFILTKLCNYCLFILAEK